VWLQLIQRSEPKVGQHCLALTHLHLLLVIVIILCVHQADYVRRRVMRDCGVALPYARLTLACAVTLAIFRVCCSVMDLTLPHQSVPTLGRPTPRLPSNENRSASLGHRPASIPDSAHSLAASMSTPEVPSVPVQNVRRAVSGMQG
jgi:hypothetical protein